MSCLILANVVCLLTSAAYIQYHFIMEENTMNSDLTDLNSYCLQYRLHKEHKQTRGTDDIEGYSREVKLYTCLIS